MVLKMKVKKRAKIISDVHWMWSEKYNLKVTWNFWDEIKTETRAISCSFDKFLRKVLDLKLQSHSDCKISYLKRPKVSKCDLCNMRFWNRFKFTFNTWHPRFDIFKLITYQLTISFNYLMSLNVWFNELFHSLAVWSQRDQKKRKGSGNFCLKCDRQWCHNKINILKWAWFDYSENAVNKVFFK